MFNLLIFIDEKRIRSCSLKFNIFYCELFCAIFSYLFFSKKFFGAFLETLKKTEKSKFLFINLLKK